MSAKIKDYKVGKFQLPRQAHVVHLEINLGPDDILGIIKLEPGGPLKLWTAKPVVGDVMVSPMCPMAEEPIDESMIKRLVREAAEHGNVLHVQVKVTKKKVELLFHAFATVGEFSPSMIKPAVLHDIEVETPEEP